jgi:hypothetical protein
MRRQKIKKIKPILALGGHQMKFDTATNQKQEGTTEGDRQGSAT